MSNRYQEDYPQYYNQQMRSNYPQQNRGYGNNNCQSDTKKSSPTMSIGNWLGSLLLLYIPIVGLICYIYWLFGGGNNRSRSNFVRASLILAIIPLIVVIIIIVMFDKSFFIEYFKELIEALNFFKSYNWK